MKGLLSKKTLVFLLTLAAIIASAGCAGIGPLVAAENTDLSLSGYIMDEHCFVKKPEPELDSKMCLQMPTCAASGYGLAALQEDGTYKFYYFDGDFAPNATDGQDLAAKIINQTQKTDHIYIEVKGNLSGIRKSVAEVSYDVVRINEIAEVDEPSLAIDPEQNDEA